MTTYDRVSEPGDETWNRRDTQSVRERVAVVRADDAKGAGEREKARRGGRHRPRLSVGRNQVWILDHDRAVEYLEHEPEEEAGRDCERRSRKQPLPLTE